MLTAPVGVRYAASATGVPDFPARLLHPETISIAAAIAAPMFIVLMILTSPQSLRSTGSNLKLRAHLSGA
jgi:hypothetical protein